MILHMQFNRLDNLFKKTSEQRDKVVPLAY